MLSQPFCEKRSTRTASGLWRGFAVLLIISASVRAGAVGDSSSFPGQRRTWNGCSSGQPARAGWRKHLGSPVLGGDLGTCFDVAVLDEDDRYSMYFSWRPKSAIALATSNDGVRWSEPTLVLGPRDGGWEGRVNRPAVLRRDGVIHLWYTGQTKTHSFIGYATSEDGVHFERIGDQPVLSPNQPWEKVAVMCPHVIWDDDACYKPFALFDDDRAGLVGLRPRDDDVVEVNPLLPQDTWDYFCLDRARYHGRTLTILWDKTGRRYRRGAGLKLFVDGELGAASDKLERIVGRL